MRSRTRAILGALLAALLFLPAGPAGSAAIGNAAVSVTPFVDISNNLLPMRPELMGMMTGVTVLDYNDDGLQDIFIPDHMRMNYLFRNNGDGTFTDVAAAAGVKGVQDFAQAALAADFDNDGDTDLYVVNGTNPMDLKDGFWTGEAKNTLFRNNGDGTFTDVTDLAGVGDQRNGTGGCVGDFNNDGRLDLYVTNFVDMDFWQYGTPGTDFNGQRNTLYRQNATGSFTDVTTTLNVGGPKFPMYDNQGNKISAYNPSLVDSVGMPVGEDASNHWACSWVDLDGDADLDLVMVADNGYITVYRNENFGQAFTELSWVSGFEQIGGWMGLAWADFDLDGDLDLFPSNVGYGFLLRPPAKDPWFTETADRMSLWHHRFRHSNFLAAYYRNEGTRTYPGYGTVGIFNNVASSWAIAPSAYASMRPEALDRSKIVGNSATMAGWQPPTGLEAYDFGFGSAALDVENDGDQDLYWIGSWGWGDSPHGKTAKNPGRFLRNEGQGRSWTDISVEARTLNIVGVNYQTGENLSLNKHEAGSGVARGDFNNDGYDDLVTTSSMTGMMMASGAGNRVQGGVGSMGQVQVFQNGGGTNKWLKIKLVGSQRVNGTGSNADGIGAKIVVTGAGRSQIRQVLAGDSSASQHSLIQSFGLGPLTTVNVQVFWPSGRRSTMNNVSVNQLLTIVEPGS